MDMQTVFQTQRRNTQQGTRKKVVHWLQAIFVFNKLQPIAKTLDEKTTNCANSVPSKQKTWNDGQKLERRARVENLSCEICSAPIQTIDHFNGTIQRQIKQGGKNTLQTLLQQTKRDVWRMQQKQNYRRIQYQRGRENNNQTMQTL